jgi:hypothetical protein
MLWKTALPLINLLILLTVGPISAGAAMADPWIGTYRHDHQIGNVSGVAAQITYTLTVHAGTATKGATLTALGYQTNDKVLCVTKADGDKLQVFFRSYPDGDTANQYGVELYQPGALLLTLERRGGQLITRWGEYNAEAATREREGVQFKKISPAQLR